MSRIELFRALFDVNVDLPGAGHDINQKTGERFVLDKEFEADERVRGGKGPASQSRASTTMPEMVPWRRRAQRRVEDSALFYFASKIATLLKAFKKNLRNSGTSSEVHHLYSCLL